MTITHADGFPVVPVDVDAFVSGMGERYDVTIDVRSGVWPLIALAEGKNMRTRLRSGWHKTVGAVILVLGVAIAIVNDMMLLGSAALLPGGHNEAYLFLGVGIAGYSTRWFGWFDRAH